MQSFFGTTSAFSLEEKQPCDWGEKVESLRGCERKLGKHMLKGKLIEKNCCQRRGKRREEEWEAWTELKKAYKGINKAYWRREGFRVRQMVYLKQLIHYQCDLRQIT